VRVVLDDEQDQVVLLDGVAIVGDVLDGALRQHPDRRAARTRGLGDADGGAVAVIRAGVASGR
jgi:hypothetical protein